MNTNDYQALVKMTSELRPDLLKGFRVLAFVTFFTAVAIFFSFSKSFLLWLVGQILFGLAVLQWFCLLHDFGHNNFFRNSRWNWFFGYISSIFCLVPFAPWKWIHTQHHTWTGWHDLDPTQESTIPSQATPLKNSLANWSWRLGIPALTLAFSFKNFWNLPRLFRLFKDTDKRMHFIFSILLLFIVFSLQVYFIPNFWKVWLLGYCIFLIISDPLLISQHVHIEQKFSKNTTVSPVTVKEQDVYTRTLLFPNWVSRFLLLSFDKHTLHHVFPRLACYHLSKIDFKFDHSIHWLTWLKRAKSVKAEKLLFSNNRESGLNL